MVLIPGILAAIILGWNGNVLQHVSNYYAVKRIFPYSGVAKAVEDGDTFSLRNGLRVRLLGINAGDKGDKGYQGAKDALSGLLRGKTVYMEYDRYMDDKYGRVLAWVWTDCEDTPTLLPSDYMHLTYNSSRPGLMENPKGCTKGTLVNEELVRGGFAQAVVYKERGELKYEKRLMNVFHK